MRSRCPRLFLVLFGATTALAQNAATTVTVDANASRHAINPNIYGVAYGDAHDMAALNVPLNRWGGNSTTRYNWQIDAHSAAADWYFETYSDGSGTPGGSADAFVATTRSADNGAEPLFTIPMIDYLANLGPGRSTLEGFSVKKYGAQATTDPYNSDAGNGVSKATGKNLTGNDPLDTGVANSTAIQQAWVQHFVNTNGASTTANGIKYYILDNEPSLWYSTHRDVHPSPLGYDELWARIVAYATAIRAVDPSAKIVGPEEWGWWAMYFSGLDQANGNSVAGSDYNTHGHTYYYPWLLQQLAAYKQHGVQLIDVFTVHAYNGTPDGSDDSAAGQLVRNRETRILWDPSFSDPSWYGDIGINGRVIDWIPTLKAMINQYCPGLQLGFTEYNWGDEANLNGATTQADVLGIYGREGVDLATRWTVATDTSTTPITYHVTYLASQIYRNYDGHNGTFGDTSVGATVANPDNLSSFAAIRTTDGALTVMVINKQQGSTPVTVNLANFVAAGAAQVWQINSAAQTSIARLADLSVTGGAIATTVPSQSITLLVIPAGSGVPPTGAVNTLAITSNTFPATAAPGATVSFSCQVTNTGTNAWGANHYLVLRDPAGDNLSFAALSGVASGASVAVNLSFTAPVTPGHYTYYLQGLENNVAWFTARATVTLAVGSFTGDFNGDGHTDILWENAAGVDRAIWYLNGTGIANFSYLAGVPIEWKIVGTADFDGDGHTDILWENTLTGDRSIWLMSGTNILNFPYLAYVDPSWHIAALGDFNGDGQTDILWENAESGGVDRAIWYLDGTNILGFGYLAGIPSEWRIVGTGDFNGDGQTDIVWENTLTGDRSIWLMNGTNILDFADLGNVGVAWHIAMVADFDGDGKVDLLWENRTTGDRSIWLMNGTTHTSSIYLAYVDPVWHIAP